MEVLEAAKSSDQRQEQDNDPTMDKTDRDMDRTKQNNNKDTTKTKTNKAGETNGLHIF